MQTYEQPIRFLVELAVLAAVQYVALALGFDVAALGLAQEEVMVLIFRP